MRFGQQPQQLAGASYQIDWINWDPAHINPDYATALVYGDEYYQKHCPKLVYYELDKRRSTGDSAGVVAGQTTLSKGNKLSQLWGEQIGALQFSRQITIRSYPAYSEGRKRMHTARGLEVEQMISFYFGILTLQKADLFPDIGDQIDYLGLRYVVFDVYLDPNKHTWMHTGLPTNISVDCNIYKYGDSKEQVIHTIQS